MCVWVCVCEREREREERESEKREREREREDEERRERGERRGERRERERREMVTSQRSVQPVRNCGLFANTYQHHHCLSRDSALGLELRAVASGVKGCGDYKGPGGGGGN